VKAPLFPRRVEVGGCPGTGLSPFMVKRVSHGMPPHTGCRSHRSVVDKVQTDQGNALAPRWRGQGHLQRRQGILFT
jgi:hypothetical protein